MKEYFENFSKEMNETLTKIEDSLKELQGNYDKCATFFAENPT